MENEKIQEIRDTIETIRQQAKIPDPITLIAVTKTVPVEIINSVIDQCGITAIGENRVQELLEKYDALHKENLQIHFIGTLQSNKVKYIIDKVCCIHSLDNLRLAEEIDRQARKIGKVMDVLIEINSGRESNKGGILPEECRHFYDEIVQLPNLRVRGLMTIAPHCTNLTEYQKYFTETQELLIDIFSKQLHNREKPILSMGMSENYPLAIVCGATLVRIGSAIFGKRNFEKKI